MIGSKGNIEAQACIKTKKNWSKCVIMTESLNIIGTIAVEDEGKHKTNGQDNKHTTIYHYI
jgi:hypothetical protein